MEKHLYFHTLLRKVQDMPSSQCIDSQCNIIPGERLEELYLNLTAAQRIYKHLVAADTP